MRAIVIYESMFGNTRTIAEAIAAGLSSGHEVRVIPVAAATQDLVDEADLVVVGGPTHIHGMSRANSRKGAAQMAGKPGSQLTLEQHADGPGLREWFSGMRRTAGSAAAFDTRLTGLGILTGRASRRIAGWLRNLGFTVIVPPESFLVTGASVLVPGETDRAREWGAWLSRVNQPGSRQALQHR